jgi:hypothetical protein
VSVETSIRLTRLEYQLHACKKCWRFCLCRQTSSDSKEIPKLIFAQTGLVQYRPNETSLQITAVHGNARRYLLHRVPQIAVAALLACTAQIAFPKGDARTKKEILTVIGSNLTLKCKKLSIEAKKQFYVLENRVIGSAPGNLSIEPSYSEVSQGQNDENTGIDPTRLVS